MHSHHSHSGAFCKHADPKTSPQSMIENAVQRGFTHYHLTEHIPRSKESHLYPEEVEENLTPKNLQETFQEYLVEARRCSKNASNIEVLVGAELENVDGRTQNELDFVEGLLKDPKTGEWSVDYVVGSVHHVHEIPIDFDQATFEKALLYFSRQSQDGKGSQDASSNEQLQGVDRTQAHLSLILAYLDAQFELIVRFRPEVIGHFDLCRLFERDTPMTNAGRANSTTSFELLEKVDQSVRRNVKAAIEYGALFEVNAASIRKGWSTPYPGEDILDIILEYDGKLCLSDDAHSHEQVGLNYHKSYAYLIRKGVNHLWYLTKKTSPTETSSLRGTKAEKISISELDQFLQKLEMPRT